MGNVGELLMEVVVTVQAQIVFEFIDFMLEVLGLVGEGSIVVQLIVGGHHHQTLVVVHGGRVHAVLVQLQLQQMIVPLGIIIANWRVAVDHWLLVIVLQTGQIVEGKTLATTQATTRRWACWGT